MVMLMVMVDLKLSYVCCTFDGPISLLFLSVLCCPMHLVCSHWSVAAAAAAAVLHCLATSNHGSCNALWFILYIVSTRFGSSSDWSNLSLWLCESLFRQKFCESIERNTKYVHNWTQTDGNSCVQSMPIWITIQPCFYCSSVVCSLVVMLRYFLYKVVLCGGGY